MIDRCPKCGESLGLVRADDSQYYAGALVEHVRCGAVLVIERIVHGEFKVRLSTKEERGE